ncbi:endo alpha-1,4 polygalactosaminidase, partial [Zoogloea sp.]|uniref:endo alpha-1,4 polygalactosaminidase n=1 Tax=Zoogloea sp. TaxID=49181 RepID=UPI0026018694
MRFLALLACLALACSGLLAAGLPSVALIYAKDAPLDELKAFDIAVVDPDHGFDPASYRAVQRTEAGADAASELFAYVSLGEVHPSRAWASRVPAGWRLGENTAWSSHLIDQARPEWTEFFTETVVAPLWARGYRGLFIDTMDSYRLASGADLAAQQAGIVRTLRHLRQRFPGIRLILNRGFEFLPELRGEIHAIAAESLYQGWSPVSRSYRQVPEADREWLRTQLRQARDEFGLPAIAIDYVAPHDRALARETAGRILAEGFIPWVADPDLATLGVGSIEVLPRRILLIHNGKEAARVNVSSPHRFLEMPLNHLGYVLDYVDVNGPLPARTDGRYAGVV